MTILLRACLLALLLVPAGLRAQSLQLRSTTYIPPGNILTVAATMTNAYMLGSKEGRSGTELLVYNVQNPAAPVLVSTTSITNDYGPAYNMLLIGSTLYASFMPEFPTPSSVTTSLVAFDVTNPAAPLLRASVAVPGHWLELAAGPGGVLCVLPTRMPPNPSMSIPVAGVLRVYNSQLQSLSVTPIPAGGITLATAGQMAYVTYTGNSAEPFYLPIDLTTPSAPVPQASTRPGALSVVSGQFGFGLSQPDPYEGTRSGNTLLTYDVSNAAAPVLLSSYPLPLVGRFLQPTAGGVYTFLRENPYYLFPTGGSNGPLTAYLASPGGVAAPTAVTTPLPIASINGGAAAGNRFYLMNNGRLSIYEIATGLATRKPAADALPLYPNPVRGTLHLPQLTPGTAVTIADARGRRCLQAALPASRTLDLSALPAGLYLVRAGVCTSKLVVE